MECAIDGMESNMSETRYYFKNHYHAIILVDSKTGKEILLQSQDDIKIFEEEIHNLEDCFVEGKISESEYCEFQDYVIDMYFGDPDYIQN